MIVGKIPENRLPIPPADLLLNDTPQIDVRPFRDHELPYPCEWLSCGLAVPHDDAHLGESDLFFLTAVVSGEYSVSDVLHGGEYFEPRTGDVFIIDPDVTHWALPASLVHNHSSVIRQTKNATYVKLENLVVLQWKIPKDSVVAAVREVLGAFGGTLAPYSRCAYKPLFADKVTRTAVPA